MLFIFLVFAVTFIPTVGVESYIIICAIMCSMMIITTFSFDERSKWTRYAMIMPISKKELVAGKFIVCAIFCAVGSLFGLVLGFLSGIATSKVTFGLEEIGKLLFLTVIAWSISFIFGCISIVLLFKFGVEKSRLLLMVSFIAPVAICFGIYRLLILLGIQFTDQLVFILLCSLPAFALVLYYAMYKISCLFFSRQDL